MRKINNLIVCVIISAFCMIEVHAQSGIIEYRGVINKKYVDSFISDLKKEDIPMDIKQSVADLYVNAAPDEYVLNFNDDESYYYINKALRKDEIYNIGSKAGRNSFYTNNNANTIIEQSPSLGNISYGILDWEITSKTKIIGGFKCLQATATERLFSRKGNYYNLGITAWFAPDIALNFGPKNYKGLPGLILEVYTNKFTLTARTISLNPKNKNIKVKQIDKNAKIITQQESHERIAEMESDRKKKQQSE